MIQSAARDMYIHIRWMAQAGALHLEEKESAEWTQVKVCSLLFSRCKLLSSSAGPSPALLAGTDLPWPGHFRRLFSFSALAGAHAEMRRRGRL